MSEQLDRHHSNAALEWVPTLSAHRALSFSRRRATRHEALDKPLPTAPLDNPAWVKRVALLHSELLKDDSRPHSPLRSLALLKRSIRDVTERMAHESAGKEAKSGDDKLGMTIRFLRAAQEERKFVMKSSAKMTEVPSASQQRLLGKRQ